MLMLSTSVYAGEYKLFINLPVGAGTDIVARKMSEVVKIQSGINIQVINATAGNGLLSATEFKKERLAATFTNTATQAYLPIQLGNVPYSLGDFDIIHTMGVGGTMFFVAASSPIKTLDDLVRLLPTMEKGSIGVASADALANARALVNSKKLNVPIASHKSANEVPIQVAGGHVTVGVVTITTESVWSMAESGQLRILGVVSPGPFTRDGKTYPSINQKFNLPTFYSGAWLAVTPGDSDEHRRLKSALLSSVKDPEVQALIKRTWPMGDLVPLREIIATAKKHQDLLK